MDSGDGFDKLSQRVRSFYTVIEIYMFSRRSNNMVNAVFPIKEKMTFKTLTFL
jgi:hypothetical protein